MQLNKNIIFNKNEMTVKFLKDKEWSIHLSPQEYFLSPLFIKATIWFGGKINLERFLNVLNETLEPYYYMLSTFKKDENNEGKIVATYKPNQLEFQKDLLEIEYLEKEYGHDNSIKDLGVLFPGKIASLDQKRGVSFNLCGQNLVVLKLTILKDCFIIGYNINHAFFDQSCIHYFFKYLSNCYNGNSSKIKLPYLPNSIQFLNDKLKFESIDQAHQYGDSNLGYVYPNKQTPNIGYHSIDTHLKDNILVELKFDINQLNQFKINNSSYGISKNDIITSCILKTLTFTPLLKDDDIFSAKYACNIRRFINYDNSAQSNLAITAVMKLKIKEIRSMSILDLALYNRNQVSKINENHFGDSLAWFKYMQDRDENIQYYFGKHSFYSTSISNWVSGFNYDDIHFEENSKPISLKFSPLSASFGINIISFNTDQNGNQYIYTHISIQKNTLDQIKELSNTSNLFTLN